MRRYNEPAHVEYVETTGPPDDGLYNGLRPVAFAVPEWGRDYLVTEILSYWETLPPWWTPGNLGKDLDDLMVRHYLIRARGRREAVVELVRRGPDWFLEGVED